MRKIKYSQKPNKVNTKPRKVISLPAKKNTSVVEIPLTQKPAIVRELKFIKICFGNNHIARKLRRHFYEEVEYSVTKELSRESVHFVLGENNKEFLLKNNVSEKNIVLVDKRNNIAPRNYSLLYNKTFLLNCAAETFADNDVLCTDYDCFETKKIDKKDIHDRLLESEVPLLSSACCYSFDLGSGVFRSIDGTYQDYGLKTCLVYWNDKDIIKKWLNTHQKNPSFAHDEPPLLLTLEEIYGKLSLSDLYSRFDTDIIRTNRKQKNCPIKKDYSDRNAYFWHR